MVMRCRMVIAASSAALALDHPAGRKSDTGWSNRSRLRSSAMPTSVDTTLFWTEATSWVVAAVASP